MATYQDLALVNNSGTPKQISSTDTFGVSNFVVTLTADFTGAVVTGLTVPAGATITDATGTFGYQGAAGALSVTGTTTMDLDCSGALQINSSAGAISVGNDNVNQAVNIATGGTRTVTVGSATATISVNSSGGDFTHTIKDGTATSWNVSDGTNNLLSLNTTADVLTTLTTILQSQGTNSASKCIGVQAVAGETLTAGDLVVVNNASGTPKVYKANAGTSGKQYPIGVCLLGAVADAATAVGHTGLVPMVFGSAPAAASNGSPVYLDSTSGQATLTAPTGSGVAQMIVGTLYGANGSDTTVRVKWDRQLITIL